MGGFVLYYYGLAFNFGGFEYRPAEVAFAGMIISQLFFVSYYRILFTAYNMQIYLFSDGDCNSPRVP